LRRRFEDLSGRSWFLARRGRLQGSGRVIVRVGTGLLLVALSLASISGALAQKKPDTRALDVSAIKVSATPLNGFDKIVPSRRRFGELEWIGGLRLSSASEQFGGWSGLALDNNGRGFVAVSDAGAWMSGRISYSEAGRPRGLEVTRVGPLKALNNKTLRRRRDRDAEAVELVSGTTRKGRLLIAFEGNHRIGRFDIGRRGLSAPRSYVRPDRSERVMRGSKGFEAMTVLRAGKYRGSILAISERMHDAGKNHTGWIWSRGKARRFNIKDLGGFDITDAATLPDGGVLLLERRFRWLEGVKMRVRHIGAGELNIGVTVTGRVLLDANMSQEIDNMEGLAVHPAKGGGLVLTMISDDNFNRMLQRTLLLQFRWRGPNWRGANVK